MNDENCLGNKIMKILLPQLYILLFSCVASAACIEAPADSSATGKFEVVGIKPAVVRCESKKPKVRETKAPGCLLSLKRIGKADPKENKETEFEVYGGDGSCGFKKGKILNEKISNYCCWDTVTGCAPKEPKHSGAMWGCSLNKWYIFNATEFKKFPNDFDDSPHPTIDNPAERGEYQD
jgi:hypothetical protein